MHKISIIACARWESEHIEEWISYHLMVGFDHIYLYCNDDDPSSLYNKVAKFCRVENPSVTFLHYPYQGEQWKMYMHCIENHRNESQFITFLDIDEFLTLKNSSNIKNYISKFDSIEWDCLFLNWLFFGPNQHQTRPKGDVLENYTKRSKFISHTTKVIVRTSSINIHMMKKEPTAFWHGLGSNTYDVFNFDLKYINSLGEDFKEFYENWWAEFHKNPKSEEMRKISDEIISSAYISHFFMKSIDDAHRRIQRGLSGNFSNQTQWVDKIEGENSDKYIAELEEVEDFSLNTLWKSFHKPKKTEYFIPPAQGPNLALHKFCDQSSTSQWSIDTRDSSYDAVGVVNGQITGKHHHHTDQSEGAWWFVDLGEIQTIREIRIFHRLDRAEEVTRFAIDISDDKNNWEEIYKKRSLVGWGSDRKPLIIPVSCCTRFVRIRLLDYGFLHLNQVEIY